MNQHVSIIMPSISEDYNAKKGIAMPHVDAAGAYLMHLIGCVVHSTVPAPKPASINWDEIYTLARSNSVEALAWAGLQQLRKHDSEHTQVPAPLVNAWQQRANVTLFQQTRYEMERERLMQKLAENGIACMPLKGANLSALYPAGTRSMGDNDILYGYVQRNASGHYLPMHDSAHTPEQCFHVLKDVMHSCGYKEAECGTGEDAFEAQGLRFEFHRRLTQPVDGHEIHTYYLNPWLHTHPVPGHTSPNDEPTLFQFTDEDEYLFNLVHMFKHYRTSGCGVRFLVDEYLFLRAKHKTLDYDYLAKQLHALGLTAFNDRVRDLSEHVLAPASDSIEIIDRLSPMESTMLSFMLNSGTYGNLEYAMNIAMGQAAPGTDDSKQSRRSRLRYLWHRLYPGMAAVESMYPIVGRFPVLYPFTPIYRLCHGLMHNPKKFGAEWRILLHKTKNSAADTAHTSDSGK